MGPGLMDILGLAPAQWEGEGLKHESTRLKQPVAELSLQMHVHKKRLC
jgi:hypothetical protein